MAGKDIPIKHEDNIVNIEIGEGDEANDDSNQE